MQTVSNNLSRRKFINGVGITGLALSAATPLVSSPASAQAAPSGSKAVSPGGSYYIQNVRLEREFVREGSEVVGTATELKTLRVDGHTIAAIMASDTKLPDDKLPRFDAKGLLLLPAFRDVHIHLDKTFYGGPWRAVRPNPKGVFDRIAEEQIILPKLLPTAEERTGKLVALLQHHGSTFARSHCNIDPVVGLKNLEHLLNELSRHKNTFSYEIVAFPQHGLLLSNVEGLMREAMTMGVNYVGGLDPTVVDGNMEKSLDTMVQIAVDSKAGVDIHLHEGGETGLKAVRYLMKSTEEAKLQGKMTISHAFSLASLSPEAAKDMFTRMAALGITIATSVPMGSGVMPIPLLQQCGVNVVCGTDSVIDHWSPFGSGDILEKSKIAAQLYRWLDEYSLSRALGLATGNITPLNAKGEQVWPKAGDVASFNLVDASCSAEAVARLPDRVAVFHRGALAAGALGAGA